MQSARQTRDTIHNFQETQLAGPAILEMLSVDVAGLFTFNRERQFWVGITDRTVNGLDADRIDFVTTSDSLLAISDLGDEDRPVRADYNEVGYVLRPTPTTTSSSSCTGARTTGSTRSPCAAGSTPSSPTR